MMKKNNYPYFYGKRRSHEEMVEGTIIVNDREDEHFITTGYYDSACRELISNPFHYYIMQSIAGKLRQKKKDFFVYLAECFWGRERFLARTGIIPYNSALFKICEKIIHGESDTSEIYHLYDKYFPASLPAGTELLGILGNHDERRALNTFGPRGLRAAVALICFLSNIVMDYEGSAEGEGWKVYLDNIYVNWNQFESASYRSLDRFYRETYSFHRENRGRSYLVNANDNMVAAAIKFTDQGIWLGVFSFADTNRQVSLQFDNPDLPIDDYAFYRVTDPLYSSVTGGQNYYIGKELRTSKLHTVVTYTDRIKLLKLEVVDNPEQYYNDILRDSFFRLCEISDPAHFKSNFSFTEIASRADSFDRFSSFCEKKLFPLFRNKDRKSLELGLKRTLYHIQKNKLQSGERLLDYIDLFSRHEKEGIRGLGVMLKKQNEHRPIVFISAESEPFSKSGGLANVIFELPRELAGLGEEVYVITPFYRYGEPEAVEKKQRAVKRYGITYTGINVRFKIQDKEYESGVHSGTIDGVKFFLLDHFELFDGLYWGYTAEEKLRRRVAFARACMEVILTFGLRPNFTVTNDAFTGSFNGLVRSDPFYADNPDLKETSFLHIIHNGGWRYFDSYCRQERGFDLFLLFNLPDCRALDFSDPKDPGKINLMATGVRFADRVFTVSRSYAKQIETACDGLEPLLHNVMGINNAISRDFQSRVRQQIKASGFVEAYYPVLRQKVQEHKSLREKIESRFPELLEGAYFCESVRNKMRREILVRMRNKLLTQGRHGFTIDPDKILFTMIHRIAEQKGFQLLLEASEGVVKTLGYQGIIGGQVASGDHKGRELAEGLIKLANYYHDSISVNIGFQEVSIPLLSSDLFLMPSMQEPCGISQLEALACGCLIVARSTGGLRDTVEPLVIEGHTVTGDGFLFSDFSPASFYDAMSRCALFFRQADPVQIFKALIFAKQSVNRWDAPARQYIDKIYDIKEIIRNA